MSFKTKAAFIALETMANIFEQKIGADDLALVIGLPSDRHAFLSDIRLRNHSPTDGRGDFASREAEWDARGHHTCTALGDLLHSAEEAKIPKHRIYRHATLDSLSEATASGAKVVVILAHWRGPTVSKLDFSDDAWRTIQSRSAGSSIGVLNALAAFLASYHVSNEDVPPDRLADLLNYFIKNFDDPNQPDDNSSRIVVRDALDAVLSNVMAPGNAVEFRDAVHKPAVLITAIPEHWSGICDLAICNSMQLAETIQAGRQDRRMLTNRMPKYLDRVVPELRETFLRLAQQPQPYIKLKAQVSRAYGEIVREA